MSALNGRLVTLGAADAGEVLTLRRAAYVTEAQAHHDLDLPPLCESVDDVARELADPDVHALGWRAGRDRLLGAVSVRIRPSLPGVAEVSRLAVVPDQQGRGLGSGLLRAAQARLPAQVCELRLFTGEHSVANLRLYGRLGYVETRRVLVPAGYQLVHLVKSLTR